MTKRDKYLPRIVTSRFGEVSDAEVRSIVEVMEECYSRLAPHEVALVDLYVFERASTMEAFLAKESEDVGVVSASFGELFFATHDAWRGTPRIILCLERLRKLSKLVFLGGVRHEVGHSVLHGDLRYYLIPLPPALLETVSRFKLSQEYATNLLYLVSIAVKDYEVSRLLYRNGYAKDQAVYAGHLLTVSEDDVREWEVARGNPVAEILCLVSTLKTVSPAIPFLSNDALRDDVKRLIGANLSRFPADYSNMLLKMAVKDFPFLGMDTMNNIDCVARLVVKRIVEPILKRSD